MSTPEDAELYAKEREAMRRKSDGELRKIRATTGNPTQEIWLKRSLRIVDMPEMCGQTG
jgi:hypothetical protein